MHSQLSQQGQRIRRIESIMVGPDSEARFGYEAVRDPDPHIPWQVELIEVYDDNGIGDVMPWIAVVQGGEVIVRVPAWACHIEYEVTE